jgi:hypothetical protein
MEKTNLIGKFKNMSVGGKVATSVAVAVAGYGIYRGVRWICKYVKERRQKKQADQQPAEQK